MLCTGGRVCDAEDSCDEKDSRPEIPARSPGECAHRQVPDLLACAACLYVMLRSSSTRFLSSTLFRPPACGSLSGTHQAALALLEWRAEIASSAVRS